MFDFSADTIISLANDVLSYGYNPKEIIIFFNPQDISEEIMKEVAEKLGNIEIESADYLVDHKIYILKKQDIDEFNLTWDKNGNRLDVKENK